MYSVLLNVPQWHFKLSIIQIMKPFLLTFLPIEVSFNKFFTLFSNVCCLYMEMHIHFLYPVYLVSSLSVCNSWIICSLEFSSYLIVVFAINDNAFLF
jgi:hypothetical protein